MLAGALAGSATVLLTNPIWVVNTRMTARKNAEAKTDTLALDGALLAGDRRARRPSTLGTLLSIVRNEGFGKLFAGVVPALLLVVNPILQYTIYEQLRNMLERRKRRITPAHSFFLGALGKLAATSITYPYITVKSRMHVAGRDGAKENALSSLLRIFREEGWSGLYAGLTSLSPSDVSMDRSMADARNRNRPEDNAERHHCCLPLCLQGRSLRVDHQSPASGSTQGAQVSIGNALLAGWRVSAWVGGSGYLFHLA